MTLENTIKELEEYYVDIYKVKKIIEKNAKIASSVAAVGLIAAYPATLSATLKMYTEICKCLNIPLKATFIKEISKDITMRLTADMVLKSTIISLIAIPLMSAASAYTSVTLAGKKLLDTLLILAKRGKVGKELHNTTVEELTQAIKSCKLTDNEVKESVEMYKANITK